MHLYGKIKFNEPGHKKIGSGFSTRSDTNQAVQPQEIDQQGLEIISKDCTIYTEKTKALIRYLVNVHFCFCICDKTTRLSQEVALILKDTVYVHEIKEL